MWEELRENNNEKPHKHKYSRMKIVKLKSKEFSFNLFSFTKKIKPAVRHLFKFKFSSLKKLSPRNIKFTKKKIFISLFTFGVLSLISGVLINKILNPHHFKGAISLDKTTYTVEDDIHVNLKNISSDTDKVIIRLENDKGQEIQTENVKQLGKDKSLSLSILPTKHLKPGRYKIRASDFYGNSIVQDFVWGVLALNTNKSIYAPNETAKFEMAVLDATGKMVCDAKVTLKVTLPQSGKEEVLSTDNGKLKTTPQCDSYGFSLIPDFMAQLALVEVGQYKMHLMSHTKTGDFEISDSFEVKENVPFDVERITATRIYPYFAYPVTLRIKANQDFDGKIQEIVPEEFGVTYDTKINVPKLESKKGNKVLTWKEKFKKGEEIELTYKYKSPLVSPDFYLLGKASFIENNTKVFEETRKWQIAIDAIGGPTEVTPNADNGAQAWTCTAGSDGNCVTGHYTVLDDGSGTPSTSGYISTGTGGSTGEVDAWDMTTFTPTPNLNNITSVTAYIYDQSATNANGGTLDDVGISVYMGGAYQTDVAVTPVFNTWGWQSATFTGSWTSADLDAMRVRVTRTRQGSGSPASQDDDVQIATVYATVTYGYSPLPPKITQEGYTFENDDEDQTTGDANDSNTVQAGTTFTSGKTLTSVKKGERMTLRMHVKNTALASATQNFGLFYDRNDGIFTKVSSTATVSASGGGSCGTSPQTGSDSWDCTVIDDHATDQMGYYTSMAIDPSGNPWISYYNQTTMALTVAQYVGSGGNCNTSKAWSCTVVDDHASNAIGYYTSIAFDSSGTPWISYQNQTTLALVVAQYVGSGGNCNSYLSHTGSAAWNCTVVDDHATDSMGWYTSIAIDSSGNPWVSYQNVTTGALVIAQYVGSGGNCNSYLSHTGSAAWNCTVVDDHATDDLGLLSSLAFDSSGTPWISYYNNTTKALVVAKYVGTGGNCNSYLSHTGSAAWSCTVVDDHPTDSMGAYNSLAFDPSGNPWVSYRNSTTMALTVAQYVGSGGNCDSYLSHTGSDAWNCTVVDDHATDDISSFGSLAFDPSGNPWISYNNHTTLALVVAQYVGSGGNCDTYLSHTGSDAWNCTVVDDHASDDLGWYTSIAFDPSGNPWISYSDLTAFSLKVAKLKRSGEITIVPSLSGATGDALSASHADMTSATDATGQGDADCLTATTWNNGKLIEGEEGNLTIPDGSSASQCSEIAFVIDTSHASPSETYRFVIATDDAIAASKGKWRGPIAVSANGYPTLTIEADNTTPFVRYSKDNTPDFANCTSTSWGCLEFMDDGGNVSGEYARVAIDGSGKAWVSYFANSAGVLRVAEYVGSGGTGCTLSSAWNCVTVDDPAGTSV